MDNEDEIARPAPLRPYLPVSSQLRVSTDALNATLSMLQRAGRLESGLFWYGPRDSDGNGTVAYVVAPRQRMSWGNYHVTPQAMGEVVHRLADGWKPLAQIHSHPGMRVEHSNYDDAMIASRRALSLVFPYYGRPSKPFPSSIGVHEWQNEYWYLLDDDIARRRVIATSGQVRVEDLR